MIPLHHLTGRYNMNSYEPCDYDEYKEPLEQDEDE
jgi:hypothetical protein